MNKEINKLTMVYHIPDTGYAIQKLDDGRHICTYGDEIINITCNTGREIVVQRYFTKKTLYIWYIWFRTNFIAIEIDGEIFFFNPDKSLIQI